MEMIFLRSVISRLQYDDICQTVKRCVCIQVSFGLEVTRVNIGNRPLIEAKIKGCQVRDWIVGERDMSFSRITYMTCVNGD